MAEFPDMIDAPLRERFARLRVTPDEIEERFVRGSGAGGQKINKTSSKTPKFETQNTFPTS